MLRAIFKLIWYIIWGLIIYKIFSKFSHKSNKKSNFNSKEAPVNERKVIKSKVYKDPICGTFVDPQISESFQLNGKVYYFCSKECKEKFIKEIDGK